MLPVNRTTKKFCSKSKFTTILSLTQNSRWLSQLLGDHTANEQWQKALLDSMFRTSRKSALKAVEMLSKALTAREIEYDRDIFIRALSFTRWRGFYTALLGHVVPGSSLWKSALTVSMNQCHLDSIKWILLSCNVPDEVFSRIFTPSVSVVWNEVEKYCHNE
jgi:hypothetical protein